MFKAKCVTFKDKDGKPYMFQARSNSFLYNLASACFIIFLLYLLLSFTILVLSDVDELVLRAIIGIISLIVLVFIGYLIVKSLHYYSFTVRFSSLIFSSCDEDKPIIFCLNNTTIEFEGYSTTISDDDNSVSIPYFSKEIDDSLVKFLSDVGVSDNSQKEELS